MLVPEKAVLRVSKWCYRGVFSLVTRWLKVPEEPPQIRGADDENIVAFRPSEGFLRYMKFFFWIGLVLFDGILFLIWLAFLFAQPILGIIIAPIVFAVMIIPDIVAYIAIHLRYDTTWYVLSDRSMRLRRGIWFIHETTITYDNIQNVSIRQGPLQRHFGFANVLVETAGGGSKGGSGEEAGGLSHAGLVEGVSNHDEIRNQILAKWKQSRSAGLGDDLSEETNVGSVKDRELLKEIDQLAKELVTLASPKFE